MNREWIKTITIDLRLFTAKELGIIRRTIERRKGVTLRLDFNYYRCIRAERMTSNTSAPFVLVGDASDVSAPAKLNQIQDRLRRGRCHFYITTNNEEVAWLLNLRA